MTNPRELPIRADFPFEGRYLEVNGHRLHYIDEGSGDPIVFLHGNPTWSYDWRNIIPYLTTASRCIAVDLIGMGRSDKPDIGYTYVEHVDYITKFIEQLGLSRIVLVGHDWGTAIGLQYAAAHPDNIKAVVMIEPQALTPFADWSAFSPAEAVGLFQTLRDPEQGWPFMRDNSVFIEGMTQTIISRTITPEEHDYFREPFREKSSRKPMWVFPNQLPISGHPAEVVSAVEERNRWFTSTPIPKLLFYATPGCNVREPELAWCRNDLDNLTLHSIGEGFHYLMEENPHEIGQELARWLQNV
ncbi:haloalkane dehalogenase [Paenibacillus athensensis]|uniref:AB hydrolase-1 domain-containing protein n=1 Tax=Paenibacillus athensensis TaxID=1967502 RepID=A0A4Y8PQV8_9BACL|nr:haloalkane dehalogenase [Paenibacillus athensensis]MCD1261195.1 haloalkane dehalogenase [Paenibacillus athensensis]